MNIVATKTETWKPVEPLRLALIGCGAMTRNVHAAVAAQSRRFQVTAVVDPVRSRAEDVAATWNVPWVGTDYREVVGRADAAIVVTSHDVHAEVTCDLLERGLHVLVEKPMALSTRDADAMIAAAARVSRTLAVGLVRRYYTASTFVMSVLRSGVLGPLQRFEVTEGCIYRWQVASPFMFQRAAGGGLLADLGIHALDLLTWWLGDPADLEYRDDEAGGVDAECDIRLTYPDGLTGTVLLTRLRDVPNGWRLAFERGTIELVDGRSFEPEVRLLLNQSGLQLTNSEEAEGGGGSQPAVFLKQLDDFARAIIERREPFVSGIEGRRSVALMERCRAERRPLVHPWAHQQPHSTRRGRGTSRAVFNEAFRGRRVLVTGATGFIGSRTIERLGEEGARVRALIRNSATSAYLSRFDVEMMLGDVTDPEAVRRAAAGCDFVVHCAYGNDADERRQREVNVEGTRNVLEAATAAGVSRLVHLSTLMVYGYTPPGTLDETAPRRRSGHPYGDTKLAAENLALTYAAAGLPVVVLQPAVVYGPFAPVWTTSVLARLRSGRVILVDGGAGICNPVFVDDVVEAILLAAINPKAVGECFLISGREAVTWQEFYGWFERMLGVKRTVSMTMEEAARYCESISRPRARLLPFEILAAARENADLRRRLLSTPELTAAWRVFRAVVPKPLRGYLRSSLRSGATSAPAATFSPGAAAVGIQPPIHPDPPSSLKLFTLTTRVSIEKARRLLGYEPEYDIQTGMRMTEVWARWAGAVPATASAGVIEEEVVAAAERSRYGMPA